MKRRIEFVKVMKKTTAVAMAATTAVGAVSASGQAVSMAAEKGSYKIVDNEYMTYLKMDYSDNAVFEISFREKDEESGDILFDREMSKALMENGKIKVGEKEWTFKEAGLEMAKSPRGEYIPVFKSENKEFIKTFYNDENIKIEITTPEGYTVKADVKNRMDDDEKEKFKKSLVEENGGEKTSENSGTGENTNGQSTDSQGDENKGSDSETSGSENTDGTDQEKDKENNGSGKEPAVKDGEKESDNKKADKGVFQTAKVALLKSNHYDTTSMSGATMSEEAELLTDGNGNHKLIIHFKPAVINGLLAYTVNLTLNDGGNTEFVLKSDNSAICVVDLPEFNESSKIIEGHIYSSIMDADVALKVWDVKKTSDNKAELDKKIKEAKKLAAEKNYYEKSANKLKEEIEKAEKSSDYMTSYAELEKTIAALREKKENPFVGDKLFHLNVSDTSVMISKSIYKYARVEINENNKPVITVKYNPYTAFYGKTYVKSIKVFDESGKEIPSDYTLDSEGNGVLKFEMPYIPSGGIFKVEMKVGDEGEVIESDIQMDYTTIKSGLFRELLTDAIENVNTYLKEDYDSKGSLEEKKKDYTEKTWKKYSDTLKKAQDDLKRIDLTQEEIDKDIEDLKDAKRNLKYKIKAGEGNTANSSVKGLNNPYNYYNDGTGFAEHPVVVGWSGSKIKFGNNGDVYRVLNNGENEGEDGEVKNTGKLLIMAEDLRVKSKFMEEAPKDVNNITRYDKSSMRKYLNGEFFNNSFSDVEKKAILESEISTADAVERGLSVMLSDNAFKTKDRIFAPDLSMVSSSQYGYASNDSRYTHNPYVLRNITVDSLGRISALATQPMGRLGGYFRLNSDEMQTAPAMYISTENVLMTLQAGKDIPNSIKRVEKTEDNTWQMVLKDNAKKLNISDIEISGKEVSANYSGENIEGDTMVAAVVSGENLKNGTIKSIGKVSKLLKNGKVKFNVPEFDKNTDKLYLMSMDINSDKSISSSEEKLVDMSARPENIENENNENSTGENKSENISYDAPVKMMKSGEDNAVSMSDGAIEKIAKVTEKDGKTAVTMKFKPMKVQSLLGHLLKMKVNGNPVKVLKTDKDGNPVEVSFEVEGQPEKINAEVEVDIMNQLAGGKSAPQNVDIVIDWNSKSNVVDNSEKDKENTDGKTEGNSSSGKGGSSSGNSGSTSGSGSSSNTSSKKSKMYEIPVSMKKYGTDEDSMSSNAVEKTASVVEKNGEKRVIMKFKPLQLRGMEGHLMKMTVDGKPVEIISEDSSKRPVEVAFNVSGNPEKVTAEVEVDVMNELAGGKSSPQKVDIILDWLKKSNEKEVDDSKIPSGTVSSSSNSIPEKANSERIAGKNRYETSVEISKKYFKTADNVVLASGNNFADALVSASYAKKNNAPTLLTDRDSTDSKVLEEISRLGAKKVTIIGGNLAVSEKVENNLKSKGLKVERIAGRNRYETSQKIAEKLVDNKRDLKIALVNGEKSADALAVSSLATKEDIPVVMIENNGQNSSIKNSLKKWNVKEVIAIGGENSISEKTLKDTGIEKTSRISGKNRVETALEIAKKSYTKPESVFVADGDVMIDALSAGSATYKAKAPILLVQKNTISDSVKKYIKDVNNIISVGGEKTINIK